nr:B53 [uncultured bacterium]
MTLRIDPEQNEIKALKDVAEWRGLRVLEIGCGDGRLTRRIVRLGANVQAIDPDTDRIKAARQLLPKSFASRVRFEVGSSQRLTHPRGTFDLVLFAWSL